MCVRALLCAPSGDHKFIELLCGDDVSLWPWMRAHHTGFKVSVGRRREEKWRKANIDFRSFRLAWRFPWAFRPFFILAFLYACCLSLSLSLQWNHKRMLFTIFFVVFSVEGEEIFQEFLVGLFNHRREEERRWAPVSRQIHHTSSTPSHTACLRFE